MTTARSMGYPSLCDRQDVVHGADLWAALDTTGAGPVSGRPIRGLGESVEPLIPYWPVGDIPRAQPFTTGVRPVLGMTPALQA